MDIFKQFLAVTNVHVLRLGISFVVENENVNLYLVCITGNG